MSNLIQDLPINNNESPTMNEHKILDNYFPNNNIKLDKYILHLKLSMFISFISVIIILSREIYLPKLPIYIYLIMIFAIIFGCNMFILGGFDL